MQRGAEVIIGDLDVVEGNATAEACNGFFIELDVTNESNVMDMCESIGRRYLRLDGLVQTAGILRGAYVSIEDFSVDMFRKVLEVNTVGAFMCKVRHATTKTQLKACDCASLIWCGSWCKLIICVWHE